MKKLVLFFVLGALVPSVLSQSTKRKNLHPDKIAYPATINLNRTDTITDVTVIAEILEISNFQKTVTSRVETLMLTNLSENDTIKTITLDINYLTEKGLQLNRRTVTIPTEVPPGQTRHASFPSWDKQQLFYHVSTPPVRKTQRTTPFTTTITPLNITIMHAL